MNPRDVVLAPGDRVEYVGWVTAFRGTRGTVQGPAYQGRLYVLWDGQTLPAAPDRESLRLVKRARDCFRFARCQCDDFRAELARVNRDLSDLNDENAELRARDANAYMRAAAELELRQADSRVYNAERRAEAAEREARDAKAKLARIGQVIAKLEVLPVTGEISYPEGEDRG